MGKRSILIAGILGVIFGSIWLVWWVSQDDQTQPEMQEIFLPDEASRTAFLEAQGISESRCLTTESVRLPVQIDASYAAFAALQGSQSLPLAEHLGETALCYTYIQNSSGQKSLRTELLVSESGLLLGVMQYDPADPKPQQLQKLSEPSPTK